MGTLQLGCRFCGSGCFLYLGIFDHVEFWEHRLAASSPSQVMNSLTVVYAFPNQYFYHVTILLFLWSRWKKISVLQWSLVYWTRRLWHLASYDVNIISAHIQSVRVICRTDRLYPKPTAVFFQLIAGSGARKRREHVIESGMPAWL